MSDFAFFSLVLAFFAASWGLVTLCERLKEGGA